MNQFGIAEAFAQSGASPTRPHDIAWPDDCRITSLRRRATRRAEAATLYGFPVGMHSEPGHFSRCRNGRLGGNCRSKLETKGFRSSEGVISNAGQIRNHLSPLDGYLWANPNTGQPLTWIDHIFKDPSRRIGIDFSCHDLRTTGATWLADAHVDELVIAILLGHRSQFDASRGTHHFQGRNVTRGYTKVFAEALCEAVAVFDDIRLRVEASAVTT